MQRFRELMHYTQSKAVLLLLLSLSAMGVRCQPIERNGPFGFYEGETKAEVIAALGRASIKSEKGDQLIVNAAPKPYAEFEEYELVLSSKDGLVKVVGIGRDITEDAYGSETRSRFSRLKEALTTTYGKPSDDFDFLQSDSIWNDPRDWMMGLAKKERTLRCFWSTSIKGVHLISLSADGLSSDKGYINLGYEFDNFEGYASRQASHDNGVL
jgi:hypothetical protein